MWLDSLTNKRKKKGNKEAKEVSKFLNSPNVKKDIKEKGYSVKGKDKVLWKQEPSLLQKATGTNTIENPTVITSDGKKSKIKKNGKTLWKQR